MCLGGGGGHRYIRGATRTGVEAPRSPSSFLMIFPMMLVPLIVASLLAASRDSSLSAREIGELICAGKEVGEDSYKREEKPKSN